MNVKSPTVVSAIMLQFDSLTPFPILQPGPIATLGPNLQSTPILEDSWTKIFPFFIDLIY